MKSKIKILIMDNEEDIIQVFGRFFEIDEFDVFGALTSQEALDIFRREKPEICILDIIMGSGSGMNGVEVLREIRKSDPETVCLILSTNSGKEKYGKQVDEIGVFDFLIKPVSMHHVRKVVADAAETVRQRRY